MLKQDLEQEMEETYRRFAVLVGSIPEEDYSLPSKNPAWTVGDILFHITLGPWALALEVWMIAHAGRFFGLVMRNFPSRLFNSINAWFGRRRSRRINRRGLLKAYGRAHTVIRSSLRRMREEDFSRSVAYPPDFVSDLAGEVTPERLFRYVKGHFEIHKMQLEIASGEEQKTPPQ